MNPDSQEWRDQVERDFSGLSANDLLAILEVYVESSEIPGPEGEVALQELRKRLAGGEQNRSN